MGEDDPIVIADEKYFNALMDATRAAHEENGQHQISVDKCAKIVWRGVTKQQALMAVIGDPLLVKAFISLEIDPVYYSEDYNIFERILFVRKEFRRHNHAARLIRYAKHVSDEMGMDLMVGIISDHRLEAKARLYERELAKGGVWFTHHPAKPKGVIDGV
jgi:hypothetical protein